MNKQWYALVAVGVIVIGSFFFFKKDLITNYPPKGDTILAFGDSLVVGVGATSGNDFVSRASRSIGKSIDNFGVSGDTTRGALLRTQAVLDKKPHVVLILLGGNDALKKIPKEETEQNLMTIVQQFQMEGAITVLLGVRGGLLGDPYKAMYKRIARQTGSVFVPDVLDGLFGDSRYMSDAIHPNDAGYERIATRVASVLTTLYQGQK